jgi:hypothetical protein
LSVLIIAPLGLAPDCSPLARSRQQVPSKSLTFPEADFWTVGPLSPPKCDILSDRDVKISHPKLGAFFAHLRSHPIRWRATLFGCFAQKFRVLHVRLLYPGAVRDARHLQPVGHQLGDTMSLWSWRTGQRSSHCRGGAGCSAAETPLLQATIPQPRHSVECQYPRPSPPRYRPPPYCRLLMVFRLR